MRSWLDKKKKHLEPKTKDQPAETDTAARPAAERVLLLYPRHISARGNRTKTIRENALGRR